MTVTTSTIGTNFDLWQLLHKSQENSSNYDLEAGMQVRWNLHPNCCSCNSYHSYPVAPRQDRLIWLPDSKAIFSVKYVHKVSFTQSKGDVQPQAHWKKLWKARFPERLKMLIWRIGINAISPPELIYNEGSNMLIRLAFFVTHVLKLVSTSSLNATLLELYGHPLSGASE